MEQHTQSGACHAAELLAALESITARFQSEGVSSMERQSHVIYRMPHTDPSVFWWECTCGESWPGDKRPTCPTGRITQPDAWGRHSPECTCEDCTAEQDSLDSAEQWTPAQLTQIEAFEAWYHAAKRYGRAHSIALAAYQTYAALTR